MGESPSILTEIESVVKSHGFFLIKNHGIQKQMVATIFETAKDFFDQTETEKNKFPFTKDNQFGYVKKEILARSFDDPDTRIEDAKEAFSYSIFKMAHTPTQ